MLNAWLQRNLACPRDAGPLRLESDVLSCSQGHSYPVVQGIPILLLQESVPTQPKHWKPPQPTEDQPPPAGEVDPFVQRALAATSGNLYRSLSRRLTRYPIPELPLPPGEGKPFLDLGCNWGRWCLSAGRKGYFPIGIDPNLEAVLAARRVAAQLGVSACFLVADARHLPFAPGCVDVVFSYSVLQHFDKKDVGRVLRETARTLKPAGVSFLQMANARGLHNFLHQLRRGFRPPAGFEVRYWTPKELRDAFGSHIGPTTFFADGYFSLNPQPADADLLPPPYRWVVRVSEFLRKQSARRPWLALYADSLYVHSCLRKQPSS